LGKLASCLAVIALGLVGFVASAQAATLTIGNPLTAPVEMLGHCKEPAGCASALLEVSDPGGVTESPVDATITSWQLSGATNIPGYRLHTLRSEGGNLFKVTGTSAPVLPTGSGIQTFSTSLPIQKGEFIALDVPEEGGIALYETPSIEDFFNSSLEPGTEREGIVEEVPYELGFNATITTPDLTPPPPAVVPIATPEAHCVVPKLKGKKLKAAKRAIRAGDCKVGHVGMREGVTAKTGTVIKQRPKPGTSKPAGSTVNIKLG
jgi:hypothetical protein